MKTKQKTETSLDMIAPGGRARVRSIAKCGAAAKRLEEFGFIPGENVAHVMDSPLGDPSAYMIRGTLVALRRSDAKKIAVTL